MPRNEVRSPISRPSTRRRFLTTSAALGTAALASPWVAPASVFSANAPSNRIHVAVIGNGNQSTLDLRAFLEQPDTQVLALCDVNTASYGYLTDQQFLGRMPTQEKVDAFYAKKSPSGQYKGCAAYGDFREVLARKDIDVVVIVVPDH